MYTQLKSAGLLLAGAALSVAPLAAQSDLKRALPEKTILYVSAPDLKTTLKEMQNLPLCRMWREQEVQDFFADALKMVHAQIDQGLEQARAAHENGMIPFNPDELMKLRIDGFGFALTSLDLTPGEREPMPKVGIVLHVDFGDTAAKWREVIEFGMTMMEAQSGGMVTKQTSKVGDVSMTTLVPPVTDMSLNVAFVGNGMVLGSLKDETTEVLSALTGDGAGSGSLFASGAFQRTAKNLDRQGAEIEAYFQLGPILDFGMRMLHMAREEAPDFPEELDVDGIGRAIDALGLRSIKAAGATATYKGNKCVTKGFTLSPAPERKGLFAGGHGNLDLGFLKWVPKDAAGFGGGTFDLAGIYDALVGALKAYNEDQAEMMLGMLSQYEQQLGISIKEDLLGSLGNEYITWSMPLAAFGTTPEMAVLLKMRDQERFLKTLKTACKLTDGMVEIEESERRGITVYQVQINFDPTRGMGFNPLDMLAPTFSFKNGYLVAGFSPGDVKRVFTRMDRQDDPTGDIRGNPEFAPYLDQMPEGGVTSLSFTDWKAQFEGLYQIVTSLAAFIPLDDEVPIDLSLLPDVQTLTQHLFGAVSWTTTTGEGTHAVSVGPWGPETVALIAGAVGAGVGAAVTMSRGRGW